MREAYKRRIAADMLREELQVDGTPTSQLSEIFDREPVPLQTFISDSKYLNNFGVPNFHLSDIQYGFIRTLEQIFLPELYPTMVEEFGVEWSPVPMKNMLVLQWGKGSGKDSMCRIGVTRVADLLQSLKSPQIYFGLPENDDIHLLNVAASSDQARRAFFAPMKRLFVDNKHLSQFFRNGKDPSDMSTSIQLEKNIELVSGHSMADTQEGLNLIVGIADEISAFKTREELQRGGMAADGRDAKTAEQIVKMLRTSARTRFPQTFKVAQISYPRFKGDAIQNATQQGLQQIARHGDDSSWYVSGPFATWDVNPNVGNRKFFEEDYDEDPEMAAAMYECKPSGAVNRFMRNDDAIAHAFSREIPNPISVEYYWGLPKDVVESRLSPTEREGWQVQFYFSEHLKPMAGAAYAMHGDLAIKGDRAGVAMSHVRMMRETQPNAINEMVEPRPIVRNDFVFAFEADLKATNPDGELRPREIQIRWYRQLIWELMARGFYIARVTADSFQSIDMLQILESRGIEAKVESLDRGDKIYQHFKDVIYDNRLESYKQEITRPDGFKYNPVLEEVSSLRVLPTKKIDHPPSGSKDYADALAGSVWGAVQIPSNEGDEPESIDVADPFLFSDGPGQQGNLRLSSFGGNANDTMYNDDVMGSTLAFG